VCELGKENGGRKEGRVVRSKYSEFPRSVDKPLRKRDKLELLRFGAVRVCHQRAFSQV